MKVSASKEKFQTIKAIAEWTLIGIALCIVVFTIISVTFFDKNDRSIFGFRAYVCMSDSMKATDFGAGDIVVVKEVEPSTLVKDDIIAYVSGEGESQGKTITHKIRNIKRLSGSEPTFVTYGTTTGMNDEEEVTFSQVVGKYVFHIPVLGHVFLFLQTVVGFLLCVFLPLMILFVLRLYRSIKLQKEYLESRKNEENIVIKELEDIEGGEENEKAEKISD